MPPSQRSSVIRAATVARTQTYLSFGAFLSALLLGCTLHYRKIVKNGVAGYPEEWFPSVSATIGDWYPERNVFQILIALNSGPRFVLVYLQYYLHGSVSSNLPSIAFVAGVLRTLACGGWVYITSTDDHDAHDILMISYIVLNIPWMYISTVCTPLQHASARRRRRNMAIAFFLSMVPMIYFFIQHKVHRIPGAYTNYSFFEWGLIFFDILHDSALELELKASDLKIAVLSPGPVAGDAMSASMLEKPVKDITQLDTAPNEFKASSKDTAISQLTAQRSHAAVPNIGQLSTWNQLRAIVSFSSDVYLSYIYWSIITSLTPTLFYFSVWELALTGSELSLLALLSPVLFVIPSLLSACASRTGRSVLHVLSLVGLGAYALTDPMQRLFAVISGTLASNLGMTAKLYSGDAENLVYQTFILVLGFFATSISKLANHSVNPVWPIANEQNGGYNKTGICLAFLAICELYLRPKHPTAEKPTETSQRLAAEPHWFPTGLALGSWLFMLHYLLGDAGTLIAWSWSGYPIQGPVPNQHGSLTHVAQAVGILVPVCLSTFLGNLQLLRHPLWFAYGAISAYIMYTHRDWMGYAGGASLSIFLISLAPMIIQRAKATGRVALTSLIAWLFVCILYVTSVFTVAYAFVPFGEYLRERTDLILAVLMAALMFSFQWPAVTSQLQPLAVRPRLKVFTCSTVALMTIVSFLTTVYHWPSVVPIPHREGSRLVRAGIWTVHFGIDNEGRDSQRRMLNLIKDMELDVVGLLETDLHRTVFGNRDLTLLMAEELGFYVDIGPGPEKHTWGAALLSKFPIVNSTHHLLPSPHGELAPAIEAVLDMYGTGVTVVVAHNGQEETPLDRELQATELARIMAKTYPQPVIFLGYVVTKPLADRPAPYQIMVDDGKVHDIDRYDWDRWCEYIFYRGLYRTAYARVSRSTITDTELQIGQFMLPRHGSGIPDDSEESRYIRAFKEQLPEEHWFPMEYYPETGGKRGHFYHVFDTPLYYQLPEGALV